MTDRAAPEAETRSRSRKKKKKSAKQKNEKISSRSPPTLRRKPDQIDNAVDGGGVVSKVSPPSISLAQSSPSLPLPNTAGPPVSRSKSSGVLVESGEERSPRLHEAVTETYENFVERLMQDEKLLSTTVGEYIQKLFTELKKADLPIVETLRKSEGLSPETKLFLYQYTSLGVDLLAQEDSKKKRTSAAISSVSTDDDSHMELMRRESTFEILSRGKLEKPAFGSARTHSGGSDLSQRKQSGSGSDKTAGEIQKHFDGNLLRWEFDICALEVDQLEEAACALLMHAAIDLGTSAPSFDTVKSFVHFTEQNYLNNPYHNFRHAVDVTQTLAHLLFACGTYKYFDEVERFSMLAGALIHDVKHPGRDNRFHTFQGLPQALVYNDRSVLENQSLTFAFTEIITEPRRNIFSEFSVSQYQEARSTIIEIVLNTDMSQHFELVAKFNELLDDCGTDPFDVDRMFTDSKNARLQLASMLLHFADISNPAKPWPRCQFWSERINKEMLSQGRKEKKLGIPVLSHMDPATFDRESQALKFQTFLVSPCFASVRQVLNDKEALVIEQQLESNYESWLTLQAEREALPEEERKKSSTLERSTSGETENEESGRGRDRSSDPVRFRSDSTHRNSPLRFRSDSIHRRGSLISLKRGTRHLNEKFNTLLRQSSEYDVGAGAWAAKRNSLGDGRRHSSHGRLLDTAIAEEESDVLGPLDRRVSTSSVENAFLNKKRKAQSQSAIIHRMRQLSSSGLASDRSRSWAPMTLSAKQRIQQELFSDPLLESANLWVNVGKLSAKISALNSESLLTVFNSDVLSKVLSEPLGVTLRKVLLWQICNNYLENLDTGETIAMRDDISIARRACKSVGGTTFLSVEPWEEDESSSDSNSLHHRQSDEIISGSHVLVWCGFLNHLELAFDFYVARKCSEAETLLLRIAASQVAIFISSRVGEQDLILRDAASSEH